MCPVPGLSLPGSPDLLIQVSARDKAYLPSGVGGTKEGRVSRVMQVVSRINVLDALEVPGFRCRLSFVLHNHSIPLTFLQYDAYLMGPTKTDAVPQVYRCF